MSQQPEEWLARIAAEIRVKDSADTGTMRLVEEAVGEHPGSSSLWCMRGDLIQTLEEGQAEEYQLEDAAESYRRGIASDPGSPECYEGLGYYFDVVDQRLEEAEAYLRQAVDLGGGPHSWMGLARVVAQRGRTSEAIALLDACPFGDREAVRELRAEIVDGIWSGCEPAG